MLSRLVHTYIEPERLTLIPADQQYVNGGLAGYWRLSRFVRFVI
jgi:hypothetical protein